MAKLLGADYRLWIESSTADTFNEVKGQTKLKISRSVNPIDTGSKDSGGYDTSANGTKKLTIDVEMKPSLPDANGYSRMESQFAASEPTRFQVRKGGSAGAIGDITYDGVMNIGSFDSQSDNNDVVTATSQLTVSEAPTVDTLA